MIKKNLLYLLLFLPFVISAQSSWNMNLLGSFDYETNHNTKCNDIWGWEDGSGNEYALVGLENGFSCVDVTNPSSPAEMFFISDINSTWRDIKTWGNYAYITTEANAGLLIVDLSDMTGNTYLHLTQFSNPSTGANISFTSSHNIYIDENGIAYIFGAKNNGVPVANRGAIFLDVNANAIAPIYLGEWTGEYIHDGMARGDTLYAGCIYQGSMYIIDVSDKTNPHTIGQHSTPNNFTHNAWVSDDGDYVFTTDEQSDAYLAAYDISNINNIQEVDRIQSNPGSNSIPHNTHVDGKFLITSYYRDGTTVHDITYPHHMIQVAYYDSYVGSGNGFDGCWGTYPFLSSGNIISSDRNSNNGKGILNIYGRAFQQACYLTGNVTDGTNGNNIGSVDVTILNATTTAQTNIVGDYQTAIVDSGIYLVVFSKNGYVSDTLQVMLTNGVMIVLDAILFPPCYMNIAVTITDVSCNGLNDGSATVSITGSYISPLTYQWNDTSFQTTATATGLSAGTYIVFVTDSTGCSINDTITINEPTTVLSLSVSADTILCNGGTSIATAYPYGGVAPYFYNWSNNASTQSTSVSAGQSIITITDVNGCSFTDSIIVYQNDSILLYNNISAISCNGANDGSIAINISSGGQIPFQYSVDNGATFQNSNQFSSLSAGTYSIVVMDANLCLANAIITLTEPLPLTATSTIMDVSCYGDCDGNIQLSVIGGTPNYTYIWNTGATNANINALCDGTFMCTITDSNSCVLSVSYTVIEPPQLTTQVSQNTNNLDALANGGSMPYTYLWNTGNTSSTITPTQNGIYWLIITDNNGCISDTAFILYDDAISSGVMENFTKKKLVKTVDILGRETFPNKEHQTLFYIYDDGTVGRKRIIK